MKRFLLLILLFPVTLHSQLIIHDSLDYNFIGDQFLGPDFTVSNIQRFGHYLAIGQYDATYTISPLEKGIVLTTGFANEAIGPNFSTNNGSDNGALGDGLLDAELNGFSQTFNSARLEFDITAHSDSLYLKYMFASEEYPEYVGSQFNDLFRIYISGPGIDGLMNIATLANGDPIEVNTVNNGPNNAGPCINCAHYNYNGDGNTAPYDMDPGYLQYDGYTTGIPAVARNLIMDSTYHLIFVIADCGDPVWDSALFIESCNHCNFQVGSDDREFSDLEIYPNPVMQGESLKLSTPEGEYQILRTDGRVIQQGTHRGEIKIDPALPKGYYFMRSGSLSTPLLIN